MTKCVCEYQDVLEQGPLMRVAMPDCPIHEVDAGDMFEPHIEAARVERAIVAELRERGVII